MESIINYPSIQQEGKRSKGAVSASKSLHKLDTYNRCQSLIITPTTLLHYPNYPATLPQPPCYTTPTTLLHYPNHPTTLPQPPCYTTPTTTATLPQPPRYTTPTTLLHYPNHPATLPQPPCYTTPTTPLHYPNHHCYTSKGISVGWRTTSLLKKTRYYLPFSHSRKTAVSPLAGAH